MNKELKFEFDLILMNSNVNKHMWHHSGQHSSRTAAFKYLGLGELFDDFMKTMNHILTNIYIYSNKQNLVNNFWRCKGVLELSRLSIKYLPSKFPVAESTIYRL